MTQTIHEPNPSSSPLPDQSHKRLRIEPTSSVSYDNVSPILNTFDPISPINNQTFDFFNEFDWFLESRPEEAHSFERSDTPNPSQYGFFSNSLSLSPQANDKNETFEYPFSP